MACTIPSLPSALRSFTSQRLTSDRVTMSTYPAFWIRGLLLRHMLANNLR